MEEYIMPFKKSLKEYQAECKKLIKKCEEELTLLKRLLERDISAFLELNENNISEKFDIIIKFHSIEKFKEIIENVNNKKRNKELLENKIKDTYEEFLNFVSFTKAEYIKTQNVITAFENNKIKSPINDMNDLIDQLRLVPTSIEAVSTLIGMAIYYNSQYAKRKQNHKIVNIETIDKLSEYYNQDGSFKYNEDTETFQLLIDKLFKKSINMEDNNPLLYILPNMLSTFSIKNLVYLLEENNETIRTQTNNSVTSEINEEKEDYSIPEETKIAFQKLKKYYKNGSIIKIPENLEEFYQILKNTNLDEKEQVYIINLIKQEIIKQKNINTIKFLNKEEQIILEKASNLLSSFNHSNSDSYMLKQYIEELQTILSMLETETEEENINYLLNEIPNIIEQLSIICSKYEIKNKISPNKFIFLLNKENIPYISGDINYIDPSYKKAIYSLIPKIDKSNQSQFKKILHNEQLLYNMYEIKSQRGHVAFIEIATGIYLIIGANIPRNGYKELVNRLKANQETIQEIENIVKNPEKRNEILIANEEYLELFSNEKNRNQPKKLSRKTNN